MTRSLFVLDHLRGAVAILFVDPDGTADAFDLCQRAHIGTFATVGEAAGAAADATNLFFRWKRH